MSNILGLLSSPKGTTKNKKRLGRGQGSGRGGTSTRGHKGHSAMSGYSTKKNFEGGQMPYARRVPKFGFANPFRVEYQEVNLSILQKLADSSKIDNGDVTPKSLYAAGAVSKKNQPIKILGNGVLSAKLNITAHAVSASAKESIEKSGGSITII